MRPGLQSLRVLEELKLLGLKGACYRVGHELSKRTGFKALFNPVVHTTSVGAGLISLGQWREKRRSFFVPAVRDKGFSEILMRLIPAEDRKILLERAESARTGEIACFSRWDANYGYPINWHLNPVRRVSWPGNEHWSQAMSHEKECGDIKLTWEINRFTHAFLFARAYGITGDPRWIEAFSDHLSSWEEANPFRSGVNWSSCQELAIRSLVWIFALYAFGDDDSFREEDFLRLQRLLFLHAEHIEHNINFSRFAVHNNHLVGEALGLYAIGSLFPWFQGAERWKEKGRSLLEKDCLPQFYGDGGYCQLSHNYHRLALHFYIWACRIGEELNERFPECVYGILGRSADYLASFMNADGRLPNWGANDGALLNHLSRSDYADFRPLLSVLRYLTTGKRPFGDGPWDEELVWLFGIDVLGAELKPYILRTNSYPVSGLHVLRQTSDTFAVFRCGSVRDRFGQADQLHLDIWWKGVNVAHDGGSYLYNDEHRFHRYFMGTRGHNTVIVDGEDQMHLHRRFKWLYWTRAEALKTSGGGLEGEHYGYLRLRDGVTHRRSIASSAAGSFTVYDVLLQKKSARHLYTLHWLLCDCDYAVLFQNEKAMALELLTGGGEYYVCIASGQKADFKAVRAFDDGQSVEGWHSRYYGEKLPALGVTATCASSEGALFSTVFTGDKTTLERYYSCISC
jgi:asparagine synthase (glutamine-hydrolysing)